MRERPPLIARPVEGPVDYDALFADILRRFPKTIAYLGRKSGDTSAELQDLPAEFTTEEFRKRLGLLK